MSKGHRGLGNSRRVDETRIAPLEDDAHVPSRGGLSNETRMAPLEDLEADREPAPAAGESHRTQFATHAALFAERLRDRFSKKIYGRTPHRVLRIDEPEGPSTAGGRLARQSISLIPRRGTAPTIVCGWVDVSKKEAQLRGHESVSKRYAAHHGTPLDLPAEDYERCIDDLVEALAAGDIKVRVLVPEETSSAAQAPSPPPSAGAQGFPSWMVGTIGAVTFILGLLLGRLSH
ncbi:hypothetical protein JRI60_36695 [Archangium violaceum]|uniref:hypothetical protein n=1 Tax=Archangium violaceum TaxID=83451 RepID=UPI00194DE644|nr:hypothetical protein [Archangium violaceum]QRN94623.1 hypothetical protein JRI60_36695 [Archangium violaceum]